MIDTMFFVQVLFRWLHVIGAVLLMGGTFYACCVLIPSLAKSGKAIDPELRDAMRRRWSIVVMIAIALLLVSGLVNFVLIVGAYKVRGAYHALFGVKFLLAALVFALSSILAGRSGAAEKLRQKEGQWLSINVMLMIAIVCVAGLMKNLDRKPKPDTAANDTRAVSVESAESSGAAQ